MLVGHVDKIERHAIEGWAVDSDAVDTPVEVMIFIDGQHRATLLSDLFRPDLRKVGRYGDGNHGFRYQFPAPLLDHREHRAFVVFKRTGCLVPNGHKLLPPALPEPGFQPILVTAPGRSGTTVLMSRLGQQPEIALANLPPFELRMISYYAAAYRVMTARADPEQSTHPDHIEGNRYFIGFNPFFSDSFARAFSDSEGFLNTFAGAIPDVLGDAFRRIILSFYRSLALDQGKPKARFFAEKTNNIEQPVRDFVRQAFGQVRELILLRDPRDVFCSHISYFGNDPEQSFQQISAACNTLLGIWNGHPKDALFVQYEEMIRDPRSAFKPVAEFLGLDQFKLADEAGEARIFSSHATSGSPGSSIGRWQHDLTDAQKSRCAEAWDPFLQTFGFAAGVGDRATGLLRSASDNVMPAQTDAAPGVEEVGPGRA